MLIMWFGTGFLAKVVMAAFPTFLVSVVQAYEGAQAASRNLLRVARAFQATRIQPPIESRFSQCPRLGISGFSFECRLCSCWRFYWRIYCCGKRVGPLHLKGWRLIRHSTCSFWYCAACLYCLSYKWGYKPSRTLLVPVVA